MYLIGVIILVVSDEPIQKQLCLWFIGNPEPGLWLADGSRWSCGRCIGKRYTQSSKLLCNSSDFTLNKVYFSQLFCGILLVRAGVTPGLCPGVRQLTLPLINTLMIWIDETRLTELVE